MKKHANIPIFIPHLGCPNQCVFCNQRSISGVSRFDVGSVIPTIEGALATIDNATEVEIAFFGGSFTGIDSVLMTELLKIAHSYVISGKVSSIRCSTRPDYINAEILSTLKHYGVKVIELGLQSISDKVLSLTKRGHTYLDCERACSMVKDNGFELVGQMMIGLPESTPESEADTADFIINAGADAARIYPTVVFKETELCEMCERADYVPLSVEDAVKRSVIPLRRFIDAGVEVVRIGLCASENLTGDDSYYAGPNHPAIGELVESELYYENIAGLLRKMPAEKTIKVAVARGALSKAIGQHRSNKTRLIDEFGLARIDFYEDGAIRQYGLKIEAGGEIQCI